MDKTKTASCKTSSLQKQFENAVFILLIVSVLLLPKIPISNTLNLGFEEFIIPIMFIVWLLRRSAVPNRYIHYIVLFSVYILTTILLNLSFQSVSDYFEIYKMIKYGVIVLFVSNLIICNPKLLYRTFSCVFVILFLINLLHYFNILGFNESIEPYYATSKIHLDFFGLDSLGNPSVKRMLGTVGNPNINAIVFFFFLAFFLSHLDSKKSNSASWYSMLSIVGVILCQSRTTLIVAIVALVAIIVFRKFSTKRILQYLTLIGAAVLISFLLSNSKLNYYSNTPINITENNSVKGRFEVWQHLSEMIVQKPFFGYGPYKQYFYQNNLYAESELVLYTWRYGFIGLIMYLILILFPLFGNFKLARENIFYLLMAIGVLISAITNNPLTSPVILVLFAVSVSHFYAMKQNKESTAVYK